MEKRLYGAWITIAKMHKSLAVNKLQLQTKKQYLKFSSILKGQIKNMQMLSGSIEALKTSTICLPVVNGAKADFHEVGNAFGSAVDVMQAMGASICCVLPKVEGRSSMVSELSELAVKEPAVTASCSLVHTENYFESGETM
ncbi:QWRF motif-containing protein 9-like [Zingiber officinale]|uniref:QWRF motif-containing protein 9-like n=1 Tax=Zingiber officinale TaxID=94328 RepID=UPI001C4BCA91|nr:QWRF motif-containing protein 9-like [Zingiber officinale]